ncbi:MAG TPA: cytochrome P450 [Aggregatilinea sp.]|uniref:cytochrome P450 n=1 Tax=Aggregatilinea sp. TaxID=2806333 RepID=UPI002BCF0E5F|nr:cytochrome P450 [Aggregatilinea sp.]HML22676.1 cytochrome P450 [Aggregatilinea sp.]
MTQTIPVPDNVTALAALRAMIRERSVMAGLEAFHAGLGDVFRLNLPGFAPVFLIGPEANRFVLVSARDDLRWRLESDPIDRLLRTGLLVTDGALHDGMRRTMSPALHRQALPGYVAQMVHTTDAISARWGHLGQPLDLLDEIRRIALPILTGTMFDVNVLPDLNTLWDAVLKLLKYISPGAWLVWPGAPRPGYGWAMRQVDDWLYRLIRERRATIHTREHCADLLSILVTAPGVTDDMIRDQLLTMVIAGHDTSTAMLAWTFALLGQHPDALARAQAEVDAVVGAGDPGMEHLDRLDYLDRVLKESMRFYPPAHLGNRLAAADLDFEGYHIPAGSRVVYSPYLTHRHPALWDDPLRFDPDRWLPERGADRPHYAYVPFGGGARTCIGMPFAQVEGKIVLARLLQRFTFALVPGPIRVYMGATLEPRMNGAGLRMHVRARG